MEADFERIARWTGLTLTEPQRRACRYLEGQGYRLLIHYGFRNAEWLAGRVRVAQRRGQTLPYRCLH